MTSTRNKNTVGDYNLQQRDYALSSEYALYPYSQYGAAYKTQLPGNGLLSGHIPWDRISNNSCDIESFLFGIDSTNLTKPRPPPFVPQPKTLSSANIYDKGPVYVPQPLVMEKNQRPFPL